MTVITEFVVQTRTTQTDRPSIRRSTLKSMLGFTKMNIRDSIYPSVITEETVLCEWPDLHNSSSGIYKSRQLRPQILNHELYLVDLFMELGIRIPLGAHNFFA
jgi:hypothetical protein